MASQRLEELNEPIDQATLPEEGTLRTRRDFQRMRRFASIAIGPAKGQPFQSGARQAQATRRWD